LIDYNRRGKSAAYSVTASLGLGLLFFGHTHLVPGLDSHLAGLLDVLSADPLLGFVDPLVEFIKRYVVVIIAVSQAEGSEHLSQVDVVVVVGIKHSKETLGHSLPS